MRVCGQYTIACYYTEPYVVGVTEIYYLYHSNISFDDKNSLIKMRNLDAHFSCQDASLVLQCFYGLHVCGQYIACYYIVLGPRTNGSELHCVRPRQLHCVRPRRASPLVLGF